MDDHVFGDCDRSAGMARDPMTAEEYIKDVARRRRRDSQRMDAIVQRMLLCSSLLLLWVLAVAASM